MCVSIVCVCLCVRVRVRVCDCVTSESTVNRDVEIEHTEAYGSFFLGVPNINLGPNVG